MKALFGGAAALALAVAVAGDPRAAAAADDLVRIDHFVGSKSTAPALAGQHTQIYVREVTRAGPALRGRTPAAKVVLFIHGSGTPAEVAFDAPDRDFSWMAYLAEAGFDAFAMDMTGYGRSYRPSPMNDPCNLAPAAQAQLIPTTIPAPCAPSHPTAMTTMGSDWDDIDAVVDHLRALRGVDKVSLVAWSQGGPRSAGYAARHPAKVSRLVVLAPAYTAVAGRLRRQLGAPGRLFRAVRISNRRHDLERDARLRPGRRRLGPRGAARAPGSDLGLQPSCRRQDADSLPHDRGGA